MEFYIAACFLQNKHKVKKYASTLSSSHEKQTPGEGPVLSGAALHHLICPLSQQKPGPLSPGAGTHLQPCV